MNTGRDYAAKRSFEQTPEPPPEVAGDVDVAGARPGQSFVIHQHHARRLHFDLRLEMLNGSTPVLVSWAVPKNLPIQKGQKVLAVKVEDHPFEYGGFSGSIPAGNYGAGEVRIFDSGTYKLTEQAEGKLTIRLVGRRMKGVWHLIRTGRDGKDWLAMLRAWEGDPPEPPPLVEPMVPARSVLPFDDPAWAFEPKLEGERAFVVWENRSTRLLSGEMEDITADHSALGKAGERLVALDAIVDGVIVGRDKDQQFLAFDLLYQDGHSLLEEPYRRRRVLLEEAVVPGGAVMVSTSVPEAGVAVFEFARQHGLPGVVAKELDSRYEPGPSEGWLTFTAQG
ncbi:MAG: DNA polymerase ligase N-terminal domain-containing protein [Actinomycetota bacterium]